MNKKKSVNPINKTGSVRLYNVSWSSISYNNYYFGMLGTDTGQGRVFLR
jgi:outer membrane scaffolding protein for murein synthesis (MipA/OmpV family)